MAALDIHRVDLVEPRVIQVGLMGALTVVRGIHLVDLMEACTEALIEGQGS